MTLDAHEDARRVFQHVGHLVQELEAVLEDHAPCRPEMDLLLDLDPVLAHHHQRHLARAALVVGGAGLVYYDGNSGNVGSPGTGGTATACRQPGELFLTMAKEGSTISGFADAFAQAISYALQYGVPLQDLVDKFSHVRFEPSGMTKNPDVRFAKSIVDYIFRWLATKFLSQEAQFHAGVNNREEKRADEPKAAASRPAPSAAAPYAAIQNQEDAPPCSTCGSIMVRSGSCYKCANCGSTSGCA